MYVRGIKSSKWAVMYVRGIKPWQWAVMYVRGIKPWQWAVMYVRGIKSSKWAVMYVRGIKPWQWAVMYVRGIKSSKWAVMYVRGIHYASVHDFRLDIGIVLTAWYFLFSILKYNKHLLFFLPLLYNKFSPNIQVKYNWKQAVVKIHCKAT
jgi:hypothetical protein